MAAIGRALAAIGRVLLAAIRGTCGVGDSPQPQKGDPNPQPPQEFWARGCPRVRVAVPAEGARSCERGEPAH